MWKRLDELFEQAIRKQFVSLAVYMTLLAGSEDHYDGIIIRSELLPNEPGVFAESLAESLKEWESCGKKGIWLKLPLQLAALLQPATEAGFDFHHAKPGYVMLTKWLPRGTSTIPESALYSVGVGAFVLNDKEEVLLVQEANGILKGKGLWKFPTGLAEAGEDVHQAAEREVLEETGVAAEFDRVLAIRHSHGLMFGRSDIFFVCALRARKCDIVLQESELAAAAWHPLEEAAQLPLFSSGTFASVFAACRAYAEAQYLGFRAERLPNGFNNRLDVLMHGHIDPRDNDDHFAFAAA